MSADSMLGPTFSVGDNPSHCLGCACGGEIEWGVRIGANRALAFRDFDETEVRNRLAMFRLIWDDNAWLVRRHVGAWTEVDSDELDR